MNGKQPELGTGSINQLLFRMAIPAITAQIVNVLYNMVDRIYVGHIPEAGTLALTGLGVCMPIFLVVAGFSALVGHGGAPRASILMGKGKQDEAEKILGNSITMLILISVILTVLLFIFGDTLLIIFGASENTISYASGYMRIYVCGTMFVQLSMGLNPFITAQGFAKVSMISILIGAICNIILDPIFIFGFDMGVAGAALATVISQAVSAIWVIRFLSGTETILRIRMKNLKPSAKVMLPCLALGISPLIMQSTESIITISFNSSLLQYGGDLAVGAMTILSSVMQFSMLPLAGLTQGGQPIIGYNFGANNPARVKEAFKLELKVSLIYTVGLWLLVMFLPQIFAMIFTNDTALITYSIQALRIYMASSLFFGIQLVCQMTFIAIGSTKMSLFLAVLRKFGLLIPLVFILPTLMTNKVIGVFMAEPMADFLTVVTTSILFGVQFKKSINRMETLHMTV